MKIAINTYPLKSGHKDRGIGFYTAGLIENLKKDSAVRIQEFTNLSDVKDVSIVHYPWFDLFFHSLPINRRFKTVVTVHDVIPLIFPKQHPRGLKGKINFILQRFALNTCKRVITDSTASKNDISKYLKFAKDNISVINLAANKNFKLQSDHKLHLVKRKYKLPDRFVLYVGDANWVKNLPFLIEGFHKLIQTSSFNDVKLILIGAVFLKKVDDINHPELESLKQINKLIKEFNLETDILRPGELSIDELVSFYNLADVYVQPSLYEGFGLPLIEAFSCGTPVLSSRMGSLRETGGNAAVYFDPADLKQFVSLLKEILQSQSLQHKLSKLGFERAKKFSWDKVVDETKKIYSKVFYDE